jgi:hypothetical protein
MGQQQSSGGFSGGTEEILTPISLLEVAWVVVLVMEGEHNATNSRTHAMMCSRTYIKEKVVALFQIIWAKIMISNNNSLALGLVQILVTFKKAFMREVIPQISFKWV